jgi:hypothetical protein
MESILVATAALPESFHFDERLGKRQHSCKARELSRSLRSSPGPIVPSDSLLTLAGERWSSAPSAIPADLRLIEAEPDCYQRPA